VEDFENLMPFQQQQMTSPPLPERAARGRVMAAGLSLLFVLAIALVLPAQTLAAGPACAAATRARERTALFFGEVGKHGWRHTLVKVLQGPFLGTSVRDIPMPAGRTGACVSALDCSIEAAQQYKHLASTHAQRAVRLAGSCRLLLRRQAQRSHFSLRRVVQKFEHRLHREGAELLQSANAKLDELRALSAGPDFAAELSLIHNSLLRAAHEQHRAESRVQALERQLVDEKLRAQTLREDAAQLARVAEGAEAKSAAAQHLASELLALQATDAAASKSASDEALQLASTIDELQQRVRQADEQLADAEKAVGIERVARKSAVDLVDQFKQRVEAKTREYEELNMLLSGERLAHVSEVSHLREKVEALMVHTKQAQVDALAQKQQVQLLRDQKEALAQQLDMQRKSTQEYEVKLASERGERTELQHVVRRLQVASGAPPTRPSLSCAVAQCQHRLLLSEMLLEGTSARKDCEATGNSGSERHFMPHQAVAGLFMMVLTTSVSVASLVASRVLRHKEAARVLVAEGAIQTEGPTVENVQAEWRERVQGIETAKGYAEQRVHDLRRLLEEEQETVRSLAEAVKSLELLLQSARTEMHESSVQERQAVAEREKAHEELATLTRHIEVLEAKVSTLVSTLQHQRREETTRWQQMEKQQQHMQQDADKAQRQLMELRSALQLKTSAVLLLEEQVAQQKLILLPARHQALVEREEPLLLVAGRQQQKAEAEAEALHHCALHHCAPLDTQDATPAIPVHASWPHIAPEGELAVEEVGRQEGTGKGLKTIVSEVKTIVCEMEGGEWKWTCPKPVHMPTIPAAPVNTQPGEVVPTPTKAKENKEAQGRDWTPSLEIFSPDMAPSIGLAQDASRAGGRAGHSPGGAPQEGHDCAPHSNGDREARVITGLEREEPQWAAVWSQAVSEASSVTDEARSEISACDSEGSYFSAAGSVRSLTSDFSDASAVSSTAMSQAATHASGGSRAERESAHRERAKRKEKEKSSLRGADAFHGDKENVQNGIRARASHSQRGLRAKGLARFDLSAAPSFAATSMSVGFVAAGELPQGLRHPTPNPHRPLAGILTLQGTCMGPHLRICAHTAHVQMRSAEGFDQANACVCFRVLAGPRSV
jgi:hypothetical protein